MKNICLFATAGITSLLTACGGSSDSAPVPTPPANLAPLVEAGNAQVVSSAGAVTLLGTASDSDGSIASYLWLQTSGPAVEITDSDSAEVSFSAPQESAKLTFRLKVTDNDGATAHDDVSIDVNNSAPLVEAGRRQTVGSAGSVTLLGTASDSDGKVMSYSWQQLSGPAVVISNSELAQVSFSAPEEGTQLSFRLTVTDNGGASSYDDVLVDVNNGSPLVTLQSQVESQIGFSTTLTANADDVDGYIVQYDWQQVSGDIIELADQKQPSLSFTPVSMQSDDVIFELSVTDNGGAVTSVRTKVVIKPTLSVNLLPSNEIHFNNSGDITHCVTVQYNEFGQVFERMEYLDVGHDNFCFTEDDSLLNEEKSYVRHFETKSSGVQQHVNSTTCKGFSLHEIYSEQTTQLESYDSCDTKNIIDVSVWTPNFNKYHQFTLATLAFGSSTSNWPGTVDNPASVNNPMIYGQYENIYDETNQDFLHYLDSDIRGPDNISQTNDDEMAVWAYVLPFYDVQGNADYFLRYDLGEDGVMNTGDETILAMSKNYYSTSGLLDYIVDYRSAGNDGDWLTVEDNDVVLIRYQKFVPQFELYQSN
ncbi:MAG: hypothetical protein GY787_22475 [Alteromonadales bacterium]|nr:hypothetical protein [Alteromonadales bacterium]